jgi:cytoskeletal protein RodZ
MHRKGSVAIVVLLVVIAMLAIGGLWWYYAHRSVLNQVNISSQPRSAIPSNPIVASSTGNVTSTSTLGWQEYTNSRYGFSFEYPSTWSYTTGTSFYDSINDNPYQLQFVDNSNRSISMIVTAFMRGPNGDRDLLTWYDSDQLSPNGLAVDTSTAETINGYDALDVRDYSPGPGGGWNDDILFSRGNVIVDFLDTSGGYLGTSTYPAILNSFNFL